MQKIATARVGIARGTVQMFSDFADGGPMWTGAGPRQSRRTVVFPEPFAAAPEVMVAISMWDLDRETNTRADISTEAVSETGFELVFRTWGDSRVARIRADWMAIGAVGDEDLWDV